MVLPLNQSIIQIDRNRWQVGSLECERIQSPPPTDTLAAWKDYDCTYIIRKTEDVGAIPPRFVKSSDELRLIHEGGSLSAVWAIGRQAFCKVKAWSSAMESEHNKIAFVKNLALQIPMPEVIYTWNEQDRSYLILRRIKGSTLRDAWTSLSLAKRELAVKTIAAYCDLLAQNKSHMMTSVTGKPVLEPYLAPSGSDFLGPFTHETCARYFSVSSAKFSTHGGLFHFYHPDLGPGNIIVAGGRVAGIIDWEAAGFYPRFWISTKPSVSPGLDFHPPLPEFDDFEWRRRLRIELETCGYPQASGWFTEWRASRLKN